MIFQQEIPQDYPASRQPGKMPDMNPVPALPVFCTPLDTHWPLPLVLPDAVLLSTHFDTSQLLSDRSPNARQNFSPGGSAPAQPCNNWKA